MRVGFVVAGAGAGWLGGASYFANLFSALGATPDTGIEPCVFRSSGTNVPLSWPRRVERVRMLDDWSIAWLARAAANRLLGFDALLERRLAADGVEIVSHGYVGRMRRLASVPWIPDLQHRQLPRFFSPEELRVRDRTFERAAADATLVLASSETARRDIEEFYPASRGRVRVLRFLHCSVPRDEGDVGDVATRRGIPERFVLLPNQFWIHKNHGVVVDALRILRQRGKRVVVVCTGNTRDYRQPDYFPTLEARIRDAGIAEEMRILGIVPFVELHWLMRHAAAILNPSLFEGWSTTVEEAKTIGKRVILSTIPVHREQAPERATYFEPQDAQALATALDEACSAFDPEEERRWMERAAEALPARRSTFARTYAAIAREARDMGPRRP